MKKGTSRSQVNNFSRLKGGNQIYQLAAGSSLILMTLFFSFTNAKNSRLEVKEDFVYEMSKPQAMFKLMIDVYAYNLK